MEAFVSGSVTSSFVGAAHFKKTSASSKAKRTPSSRTVVMKFGSAARRKFEYSVAIDQSAKKKTLITSPEQIALLVSKPWAPTPAPLPTIAAPVFDFSVPFEKPDAALGTGLRSSASYVTPQPRFAPQGKRNLLKNVAGQYSPAVQAWADSQKVKGGLVSRNLMYAPIADAPKPVAVSVGPVEIKIATSAPAPVAAVKIAEPVKTVVEAPKKVAQPITIASIKDDVVSLLNLPGLKKSAPAPVAQKVEQPVVAAKVEPVVVAAAATVAVQPVSASSVKKDMVNLLVLPDISYKNVTARAAPAAPVTPVVVAAATTTKKAEAKPVRSSKKGTRSPLEAFVVGLVSALLGQPSSKKSEEEIPARV